MKKRNILSIIFSLLFILVLSACNNTTSRQNLNVFENIVFEDKEVTYNGDFHSIYVSNAPDFAEITYQGNNQKEIGTYVVTATIEADNYETYTTSAKLTIIPPVYQFENIIFQDKEVVYDGEFHSITVEGNIPEGTTITYTYGSKKTNSFKEIGEYKVKATLECEFYETLTLTATLKIIEQLIIGSNNQEEFLIDNNLKYDDFYEALAKHNFICYEELGSQQEYANGNIVYTPSSYHTYAISEDKYYAYHDYINEGEYIYDTIEFAEVINDQVLITEVKVADDTKSYYKIPKDGFYETFGGYYLSAPFTHLSETSDGGFEPKEVPDYQTLFSKYEIKNNTFELTINNFIYHPEFTNSEISIQTYSKIGNVSINIPYKYKANYENIDEYDCYNFILDGVEYLYYDNSWKASIDLSFYDVVLIKPQEIIILPEVYNVKVYTISYPYYVYNKNYTGYTFNVYFNEDFEYQGEYENYGSLNYNETYSSLSKFEYYGGEVKYYGQW